MHMEKRVTLEYILYVFCADTNYYINCHGIFSFFNQWFSGANLVKKDRLQWKRCLWWICKTFGMRFWLWVFNATFNNISILSNIKYAFNRNMGFYLIAVDEWSGWMNVLMWRKIICDIHNYFECYNITC
jgi:hypothetical protein